MYPKVFTIKIRFFVGIKQSNFFFSAFEVQIEFPCIVHILDKVDNLKISQ